MANSEIEFDKRLLKRNLQEGTITPDQLQSHLKKLPDLTDSAERIGVTGPEARGGARAGSEAQK